MDVIFAITIWHVFSIIPAPTEHAAGVSAFEFVSEHVVSLFDAGLAIVIIIVYWLQNNALFNNLTRTDNGHTAIGIVQMFFLLVFLYAIGLSMEFPGSMTTRITESVAAALVGLTSVVGWYYARRGRRLLAPEISDDEAATLQDRIFAEPLTALLTIPCAWIGPTAWELGWSVYPLLAWFLRRRRRRARG